MKKMLEYINKIKEVNTSDIKPLVYISDELELREDTVSDSNTDNTDAYIGLAPESSDNMYVTPISIN